MTLEYIKKAALYFIISFGFVFGGFSLLTAYGYEISGSFLDLCLLLFFGATSMFVLMYVDEDNYE